MTVRLGVELQATYPSIWEAGQSEFQASQCYSASNRPYPTHPKRMAATEGVDFNSVISLHLENACHPTR